MLNPRSFFVYALGSLGRDRVLEFQNTLQTSQVVLRVQSGQSSLGAAPLLSAPSVISQCAIGIYHWSLGRLTAARAPVGFRGGNRFAKELYNACLNA
jgi:hypothetical protein